MPPAEIRLKFKRPVTGDERFIKATHPKQSFAADGKRPSCCATIWCKFEGAVSGGECLIEAANRK
jgi:hypothetical protein